MAKISGYDSSSIGVRKQVQCLEHQIYLVLVILTMPQSKMEVTQS